jgi:hypothetical protein
LGFLGANLLLQIALCVAQNFRNVKATMLEIVYTLIFVKPVLEVIRILRGEQRKPYQTFHPLSENSYAKAIEVFAEAGPAAFLQMFFLLSTAVPSWSQYISITISIATAAFTIASTDFNLDTDPRLRVMEPHFYGFVPDSSRDRAKIFIVMFVNSFCQMTALVIATASLAEFDLNIAIGAWCGRFAILVSIKAVWRDLSYFIPIRGWLGTVIAASIERPATMFLSDVSLWAYGRHPYEMGCKQWWFSRIWPWLLLVATIVLRATAPAELGSTALSTAAAAADFLGTSASGRLGANMTTADRTTAFSQVAGNSTRNEAIVTGDYERSQRLAKNPVALSVVTVVLFVPWLLSLAVFFLLAQRKCWPSFWSNETAAEYTKRVKWDGQTDERLRAMLLVKLHLSLLRLIVPEARIWIANHWERWGEEKPDWFTDRWKCALSDSVLSQQTREELGGNKRRRSSLVEQLTLGGAILAVPSHPRLPVECQRPVAQR